MRKTCAVCREEIYQNNFCSDCLKALEEQRIDERIERGSYFVVVPYLYAEEIRKLIFRYKFSDERSLCRVIAELLKDCLNRLEISYEYLSYVPSHPLKKLIRGFDPMQDVAEALSELTGRPCLKLMKRVRFSKSFFKLSRQERTRLAEGMFERSGPIPDLTVVVDDIFTTGSTVEAWYREAGEAQILFLCLSKAFLM